MVRAVVFGGRDYGRVPSHTPRWERDEAKRIAAWQRARFEKVMDAAVERLAIDAICSGLAQGADELALRWSKRRGIKFTGFRAEWRTLGDAAGPERNQRMIDEFKPEIGIAFPGGRGTADMARRVEASGARLIKVDW